MKLTVQYFGKKCWIEYIMFFETLQCASGTTRWCSGSFALFPEGKGIWFRIGIIVELVNDIEPPDSISYGVSNI